jgi:hypothetical protein
MGKGATECVVPKGNMHRTKLDRIRHANLTGKNSIQGKRFFLLIAEASISEEPGAGNSHAGI